MERYHKILTKEIIQFADQQNKPSRSDGDVITKLNEKDIKNLYPFQRKKLPLDTIYLGGGTPSTYPDHLLLDTFGILRDNFVFSGYSEVTIEVNPGTVRPEQLSLWRDLGINRISIGVQSLKDDVLQRLNRLQKADDVYSLLSTAPAHFDNISVDIILGLPGVSSDDWKHLLHELVTWPIKHVSMYVLEVHDNTPLFFKVKTKKVTLPCEDEIVELYYWSRNFLADHGLQQYEVSSFAREGYQSKHNTVYWERKPYKGFGLGACSFDGARRFQNEKNLMQYMEGIERGDDVTIFAEELTQEQVWLEHMMLGLRRMKGVLWDELKSNLTQEREVELNHKIRDLLDCNLIKENDGRLQLTPTGLVVENEIISRLSSL